MHLQSTRSNYVNDIGVCTGHLIMTDLHALCLNSWPAVFSASLDLSSASDSQTASSLQAVFQRLCNTLSPTCMAILMHLMPNSILFYASAYVTLIQTIYRAFLTNLSEVSGIGHRIHTTKKKLWKIFTG